MAKGAELYNLVLAGVSKITMSRQARRNKTKTPGVPATTFAVFSNLPTELRLMIWEEFTRTPRIIRIDQIGKRDEKYRECQFTIKIDGLVREQACPLLGVCRESRGVASNSMLLFTIGSVENPRPWYSHNRHFAIRSCDIVFFSGSKISFQDIYVDGDSDKIANIMLGASIHAIYGGTDTSECLWANWFELAYSTLFLTRYLHNRQHLEKVYGLVHKKRYAAAVKRFDMNDLCGFIPKNPPEFRYGVADFPRFTFLDNDERNLMAQPQFRPRLLMETRELAPWIESEEVLVTQKK